MPQWSFPRYQLLSMCSEFVHLHPVCSLVGIDENRIDKALPGVARSSTVEDLHANVGICRNSDEVGSREVAPGQRDKISGDWVSIDNDCHGRLGVGCGNRSACDEDRDGAIARYGRCVFWIDTVDRGCSE